MLRSFWNVMPPASRSINADQMPLSIPTSKTIQIRGYCVLVDADDADRILALKWSPQRSANGLIYFRHRLVGTGTVLKLHRLIAGVADSVPYVDHKNNDTLDNRKANLRAATCSQNISNGRKRKNTVSRFRGVRRATGTNRHLFRAAITRNYKETYIGAFRDEITAAIAFDIAAISSSGEFAKPNFSMAEASAKYAAQFAVAVKYCERKGFSVAAHPVRKPQTTT